LLLAINLTLHHASYYRYYTVVLSRSHIASRR
jgi:hypothetical protein